MALLVVSALASGPWIDTVHERIVGARTQRWNDSEVRANIDFGGLEAVVDLHVAVAHAEGRRDAWHYTQITPLTKIIYLPFAWVPAQTLVTDGTAREPAYIGSAIELLAQLRQMAPALARSLGPLPAVPQRPPPVELSSSAAPGPERVKATWAALSYAAWLSVETKTPLHGIYGEAESFHPEDNWRLGP